MNDVKYTEPCLFHYTKFDTAVEHILRDKRLRFSSLSRTNDPYEKYNFVFSVMPKGTKSEKEMGALVRKGIKLAEELKAGMKTLCFTEDRLSNNDLGILLYNLGKGFARPRMWAQYADNFHGVCLGINKEKLIKSIEQQFQDVELLYRKIKYDSEAEFVYNVSKATIITEDESDLSVDELLTKMLERYQDIYFFTKHIDWRDENEFRLIIRDKSENERYLDIDGILEWVIIGMEVKEDSVGKIKNALNNFQHTPAIFRISVADGYYAIDLAHCELEEA